MPTKKMTLDQLNQDEKRVVAESLRLLERISYLLDTTFTPEDLAGVRKTVQDGRSELENYFPPIDLEKVTTYDILLALTWAMRQPDALNLQKIVSMAGALRQGFTLKSEDMQFALQIMKEYLITQQANGY